MAENIEMLYFVAGEERTKPGDLGEDAGPGSPLHSPHLLLILRHHLCSQERRLECAKSYCLAMD